MGTSSRGALPRIFAVLLIYGNIGTSAAFSDLNLICTNDYDKNMTCRFDAPNCSDYAVKVWESDEPRKKFNCSPKNCTDGSGCCCTVEELGMLVTGDIHIASVLTGGKSVVSKNFSVTENVIPRRPSIRSVNESNGNFQLIWTSNYNDRPVLQQQLEAEVIYSKKGSQEEHSSGIFSPSLDKEFSYYEIPGQDLEPSTTYVVRVKSYFNRSGRYSVSSQEHEFKTTASFQLLLLSFIVGLSFFAVVISAIIYVCYIKLKAKWWDSVSEYSNPELLNINPNKQEVLKPVPPIVSPIYVEPLVPFDGKPWSKGSFTGSSSESLVESSGISTGSSSLSYAKTEPGTIIAGVQEALSMALNINPGIPVTLSTPTQPNWEGADLLSTSCNPCDVQARDWSSGSSGFDNKTYAIVLSNQSRAEIPCDSAYRPSEGSPLPHVDEQPSACAVSAIQNSILLPESLLLEQTNTDMLHHKQSGDSGFSCTSNSCSSSSSSSSGTNTMAEEVKPDDSTMFDKNPCYGAMPTTVHSFPPVEDVYQAFQSLVEQPIASFSEQRNGEQGQHADVFSHVGSSCMIPPSQTGTSINGELPSPLQRPLFSLISANQPPSIIMDSGYEKV